MMRLLKTLFTTRLDAEVKALRSEVDEIKSNVKVLQEHTGLSSAIEAITKGKGSH